MNLYDELRAIADQSWRTQAACRAPGVDPKWWFPEGPHARQAAENARRVCASCPVRAECWEAGKHEPSGIWGGVTRDRHWRYHDRLRAEQAELEDRIEVILRGRAS